MATLAPWPAAIRPARTPPEPAPTTNRSKSWAGIGADPFRMLHGFYLTTAAPAAATGASLGTLYPPPRRRLGSVAKEDMAMIKAVDIRAALAGRTILRGR